MCPLLFSHAQRLLQHLPTKKPRLRKHRCVLDGKPKRIGGAMAKREPREEIMVSLIVLISLNMMRACRSS